MDSIDKHKQPIGLSLDEFNAYFSGKISEEAKQKLQLKANNCDLSSFALEMNPQDLSVVNTIANKINATYPVVKSGFFTKGMYWFSGILLVLGVFVGINYSSSDEVNDVEEYSKIDKSETSQYGFSNDQFDGNKDGEDQDLKEAINLKLDDKDAKNPINNEVMGDEHVEEVLPQKILSVDEDIKEEKESSVDIENELSDEVEKALVEETISGNDKENILENGNVIVDSKENLSFVKTEPVLYIKKVESYDMVEGGKNKSYSASEIVDYVGGKKVLENEVFKKISGVVNQKDLPKGTKTITLTFKVNHRGKIKSVEVVTPMDQKLKERLENAVYNLENWEKGKVRLTRVYNLYITLDEK